jgi:formate-dependent nitrite reductase membrane component NrfD
VSGDVRRAVGGGDTYVHGDRGHPRAREERMVPREEPTTYYGRPVVKPPVWKPEIPFYFFSGGLAGASAVMASVSTFLGRPKLARRAWIGAFVGVTASPALLISDLGKPSRFLNMLRVFKVTSPMSLGAWLLAANGGATTLGAALNLAQRDRRGGVPEVAAAALGAPLATYTAVLICNTTIPAWSEARAEMPFVFGASAAASAAGAALLSVSPEDAAPARRLGVAAALVEEAATLVMHKRLGPLASAYEEGAAGKFGKAARALTLAGAAVLAAPGHRRSTAAAGGSLLLAGSVCKRWSVFKAGFQSAEDPMQTVRPQRERIASEGGGA